MGNYKVIIKFSKKEVFALHACPPEADDIVSKGSSEQYTLTDIYGNTKTKWQILLEKLVRGA